MIDNNISEYAFAEERKRNLLVRFDDFDKKRLKFLMKLLNKRDVRLL